MWSPFWLPTPIFQRILEPLNLMMFYDLPQGIVTGFPHHKLLKQDFLFPRNHRCLQVCVFPGRHQHKWDDPGQFPDRRGPVCLSLHPAFRISCSNDRGEGEELALCYRESLAVFWSSYNAVRTFPDTSTIKGGFVFQKSGQQRVLTRCQSIRYCIVVQGYGAIKEGIVFLKTNGDVDFLDVTF